MTKKSSVEAQGSASVTPMPGHKETRHERFLRIAPKRINRAMKAVDRIGNCAASGYEFTPAEFEKMAEALRGKVEQVLSVLRRRLDRQEGKPEFRF